MRFFSIHAEHGRSGQRVGAEAVAVELDAEAEAHAVVEVGPKGVEGGQGRAFVPVVGQEEADHVGGDALLLMPQIDGHAAYAAHQRVRVM